MAQDATIVDFLGASLKRLEAEGHLVFSPSQQAVADEIASTLDAELNQMVRELERAATCQQTVETNVANSDLPPFEAFCAGLESIGESLLPHLADTFYSACSAAKIPHAPFAWIIKARVDAFVGYLLQLAQVHGLAFAETDVAPMVLVQLDARLKGLAAAQLNR